MIKKFASNKGFTFWRSQKAEPELKLSTAPRLAISKTRLSSSGFTLIEVLIVTAIIGVGFLAVVAFLVFSREITFQSARITTATNLAKEGMEAVRNLRDEGWTSNIASKSVNTTYYLVASGGVWTLTTTNPGTIDNLYTRTVRFESVSRDASFNIASSGTNDPKTRKLTVAVSWTESGKSKNVTLTSYITNFDNN